MTSPAKKSRKENWNATYGAIKARKSYKRVFSDDPIDEGELQDCIEAARWAPSAHNAQPWRFVIFYKQIQSQHDSRVTLVDKMAERFREDMLADSMDPTVVEKKIAASRTCFTNAPALILACMDLAVMDAYDDNGRRDAERIMAIQSVSAAIQTLLLAIHARGLRGCWYCAPLFCPDLVKNHLGLPTGWEPEAFITAGYPSGTHGGDSANRTTRRPVTKIIFDPSKFSRNGGRT